MPLQKPPDWFDPCQVQNILQRSLIEIEECQKTEVLDKQDDVIESELILLRSGYLKQYNEQKEWHTRNMFL